MFTARHGTDRGMATAEYAVGVVGAACLACVLIPMAQDDGWFMDLIRSIIELAKSWSSLADFHTPNFGVT